jgi:hypothetical protein
MSRVVTTKHRWVPVHPYQRANGLIIHSAILGRDGFTVSHEQTGTSLFTAQPRSTALAFFEEVSQWPEWLQGKGIADYQFLKDRVIQARNSARLS